MNDQRPSLAQPVLLSGVIFGVVAAIPVINLLNCVCCAWIIITGLVAAYLYSSASQKAGTIFGPGEGALAGVLAGLVYAGVNWILSTLITLAMGNVSGKMMKGIIEAAGTELPPEVRQALEQSGELGIGALLFGLVMTVVLGAAFAALGGLIGGLIFRVTPPAESQESPSAPPPPTDTQL
jgi:hypothetical protein